MQECIVKIDQVIYESTYMKYDRMDNFIFYKHVPILYTNKTIFDFYESKQYVSHSAATYNLNGLKNEMVYLFSGNLYTDFGSSWFRTFQVYKPHPKIHSFVGTVKPLYNGPSINRNSPYNGKCP